MALLNAMIDIWTTVSAYVYKAYASIYWEFANGGTRLGWPAICAFIVIALLLFWSQQRGKATVSGYIRFLLPPDVYTHKSAVLDYKFFLINRLVAPLVMLLAPLSVSLVATFIGAQLAQVFGELTPLLGNGVVAAIAATVLVILISDFGAYVNHAAHHITPALWPLHSFHHSAEVLTPITLYRKHPLYDLIKKSVFLMLVAPLQALAVFFLTGEVDFITIFGANAVVMLFNVAGSSLRHSHIWLSYGQLLEHIFISPAQHQIHHSTAAEHHNKNFGEIFAVWDWMFGTLYVPRKREALTFGIGGGKPQPHRTIKEAYLRPVQESVRVVFRRKTDAG